MDWDVETINYHFPTDCNPAPASEGLSDTGVIGSKAMLTHVSLKLADQTHVLDPPRHHSAILQRPSLHPKLYECHCLTTPDLPLNLVSTTSISTNCVEHYCLRSRPVSPNVVCSLVR